MAPEPATKIETIVDLLVRHHGDGIRSIYLFGSYQDGTALDTSDIDLAVVTDGPSPDDLLAHLKSDVASAGIQGVDLIAFDYETLVQEGHFRIERGSELRYGEDVRSLLPPTTLELYLRRYGTAPVNYMTTVLRCNDRITPPLDYPDADGEFFGYDRDTLPPDGRPAHNVKAMVSCACWIATMTVGIQTGQMIAYTSESIRAYQSAIADEWTPLLTDIYATARQRWHYLVPHDPADSAHLRTLCRQMLSLERHYLDLYAAHLHSLKPASNPDAALMLKRIGRC